MDYKNSLNYMLKLIKSFRDSNVNDFMFIKHYNTLFLPEEGIREVVEDTEQEYCFLHYKFPKHQMLEAYQPFLGWIRELYHRYFSNETPEEFVKNAKVYPLQQYSFVQFISKGKADRIEDILIAESGYESKRMLDSLVNIFKYIGTRKKLFIIIESLHLTNLSGIQLLYHMMNGKEDGNVRIFATYNESYQIPEYINKHWKKFIQEMERQNYQYEWGDIDAAVTIDAQDIFLPDAASMEEYMVKAVNMYFFFAFEDAQHCLNIINEKIEHDNLKISKEQYVRFLQVLAIIEVHCKEYTRALQICEYIGVLGKEMKDDRILYNYNYICAMTQFGMEQVENKTSGYVEGCIQIAKKWKNPLAEYKPQILQLLSDCNYWRDIFINHYGFQISEEFMETTEKFGFKNILAYIYIYCYEISEKEMEQVIKLKKDLGYFKKGVELATELENYDLLISAYSKNIVIYSKRGYYDYVGELFQRKIEVIRRENNQIRMINSYNGMGYNAGIAEKYQKAEEYFSTSMAHLLELGNGEEIAITLYNSAVNKMLAREFAYASDDLLLLIRVMEILGIHALSICDNARFHAMLGICSFYIGEDYRCYYCLNRIEAYVGHLDHVEGEGKYQYWYDTLFMKYLLEAMLLVQDNKLEEAGEKFSKAKEYMNANEGNQYFNYPLYVQEMAKYYNLLGKEKERIEILKEAIEFCDENGYHLRSSLLMTELEKGRETGKKSILLKRQITNEEILKVVDNLALQRKLEDSKRDISFLTVWQELLTKCKSAEDVLPQTFNLLKNHFNFDGVMMISMSKSKPCIEYMDCPDVENHGDNVTSRVRDFRQEDLKKIVQYFHKNRQAFLTNRIEKGFLEYKELVEIFGLYHVVTLFAAPLYENDGEFSSVLIGYVEMRSYTMPNRYLLKEHDLIILKFASQQLHSALERLNYIDVIQKMNGQLSDMAVTDLLTGLYNRQGFEKLMQEDEKNDDRNNVILYLDLDNFKYYNDTFGHELGDYVLVRFSYVLKQVVKRIGYAVRYGGDEFVLVLKEKDLEFAKGVAKKLFVMLSEGVNPDIQRKIGEDIVIPKEKLITCSVGISECRGNSIAEALNNADKALYYVKKTTKNNYVVWEELEESS